MAKQSQVIAQLVETHGPAEEIRLRCPMCRTDGALVVQLTRGLVHCIACAYRCGVGWLLDQTDSAERDRQTRKLMNPGRDIIT